MNQTTGGVFPPACWQDILAYDQAECLAGCMAFIDGQPQPEDTATPSYRWGWLTGAMDSFGPPEVFQAMRRAVVAGGEGDRGGS